jgi:hypothetical protein
MAGSGTTTMLGQSGTNTFIIDNPAGSLLAPIGGYAVIGGSGPVNALVIRDGGGPDFLESYTLRKVPNNTPTVGTWTPSLLDLTVPVDLKDVQFAAQITTQSPPTALRQSVTQDIRVFGLSSITDSVTVKALSAFGGPSPTDNVGVAPTTNLAQGTLNLTVGGHAFTPIRFSNKSSATVFGPGGTVIVGVPSDPAPGDPVLSSQIVTAQTGAASPNSPSTSTVADQASTAGNVAAAPLTVPAGLTSASTPPTTTGQPIIARTPSHLQFHRRARSQHTSVHRHSEALPSLKLHPSLPRQ